MYASLHAACRNGAPVLFRLDRMRARERVPKRIRQESRQRPDASHQTLQAPHRSDPRQARDGKLSYASRGHIKGVIFPLASGWPCRTTPAYRSRISACTRCSGLVLASTTLVSRSTAPSRHSVLSFTSLLVAAGRLGDILGRRRVLCAGIALFTLLSMRCGRAITLSQLFVARAAQGVGAAIMMTRTHPFISDSVATSRMGSAMGLMGTMSAVGTGLGLSLGGFLIAWFDWRAIFFVNIPLGIVALSLARYSLPAFPGAARDGRSPLQGLDILGTTVMALTLAVYSMAMTVGRGNVGMVNAMLLAAAVSGGVLLRRVESVVSSPLIYSPMFRDRGLRSSLAMRVLVSSLLMSTRVIGPFYLSRSLALSATSGVAIHTRRAWLPRCDCDHDGRIRTLSDSEQPGRHVGRQSSAARCDGWTAQLLAQSRPAHWRIGDGRRVHGDLPQF